MNKLSLLHLQLVNAVVKEGTLTKAAEKLHLSQPALSHQLKKLECKLGLKVFNRVNRKLLLTSAGVAIFNASEKIILSMNDLSIQVKRLQEHGDRVIRVSTECYTCYHWLPDVVQQLRAKHEEIDVQINIEATEDPLQYLMDGKIDLALVNNVIKNSSIRFEALIDDDMVVVMSKHNKLALSNSVELSDLKSQNLVLYDIAEDKNFIISNILQGNTKIPKSIQKLPLTEAIIELVSANIGVSILASWAVEPFLLDKGLVALPLTSGIGSRQWWLASLNEPSHSEKAFIETLRHVLNEKKSRG